MEVDKDSLVLAKVSLRLPTSGIKMRTTLAEGLKEGNAVETTFSTETVEEPRESPTEMLTCPTSIVREIQAMGFSSDQILNAFAELELRGIDIFSEVTIESLLQLIQDLQYSTSENDMFRYVPERDTPLSIDVGQQTEGPEENATNRRENDCIICMEEDAVMTFIPCGHVKTCQSCSELVFLCPVCRKRIRNRLRIWF